LKHKDLHYFEHLIT